MKIRTIQAPAAVEPAFKSTDEQMVDQEKAANSTAGLPGSIAAFAEGTLDAIPGAKYAQAKLLALAGIPEEFTAKKQAQLADEHAAATLGGALTGATLLGKTLAAPTEGMSTLKKIGTAALAASVMEPASKLGQIANEAQIHHDALQTEQYAHIFDAKEMLAAAGLAAVTGGLVGFGGSAAKLASKSESLVKGAARTALVGAGFKAGGFLGAAAGEGAYEGLVNTKIAKRVLSAIPKAGEVFDSKLKDVLGGLLGTVAVSGAQEIGDIGKNYDELTHGLRSSMANPDQTSQRIRAHFESIPPHIADALAANTMDKLQAAALDIPADHGPATAFGLPGGISDRQKREFLRKTAARFDPFGAVNSGRPELIQIAEQHNPETVHAIKQAVISELSNNPNVSYMTKRRVSGILGVAGTPTQDPATGAQLQQIIQTKRQANDSQGQMKSARQANASLKNNSATLTRAQRILNQGE